MYWHDYFRFDSMLSSEEIKKLSEKQKIEYYSFFYFVQWQKKEFDKIYDFILFGKDAHGEPDILANRDGEDVWIELTTVAKNNFDHARVMGKIKDENFKEELSSRRRIPLNIIEENITNSINNKQRKNYSVSKPILVLRVASPIYEKDNFIHLKNKFNCGQFESIWLVCDIRGETGIIRLDSCSL